VRAPFKRRYREVTCYGNWPPLTTRPDAGAKCHTDVALDRMARSYLCQRCGTKGAMQVVSWQAKGEALAVRLFCRRCAGLEAQP
jgi:hypothetical protein